MNRILLIFLVVFGFSQVENEKLYITIQMMDQIGVVNTETNQLDFAISIEIQNYNEMTCMEYATEMECSISSNCEWMGGEVGMCMEISEDCMEYTTEMECSMSSNCEWMGGEVGMCMESSTTFNTINTPHYIVMDEILGYWFITTIASGYVAQYSLTDNSFIDSYFVGDAPAILTIDTNEQIIYCSRMMPMNGMGDMMPSSESNIIQALSYSHMGLMPAEISEYIIDSPAPHGITISDDGENIFTASNTADWLYKINTETGEIIQVNMDQEIGNPPDQTTQRLKPIQCLYSNGKLFVSCSAGPWYNPFTGETSIIPGMLQMWDAHTMTLIDTISLGDYTSPWHIIKSPIDNIVYVALAGDNLYDTGGIGSIRYENNSLSIEWVVVDSQFNTPHGIDVSNDGERIYISDRGNGNIYAFNSSGELIDSIFVGSMSMLGGISITQKNLPAFGDVDNNQIINVIDIIMIVNTIIDGTMLSPYQNYSADFNQDSFVNVSDIIEVINIIIN